MYDGKIAVFRNAGIKCAIMSTVSGTNIEEIPNVVDLIVEHKVDIFAFGRYCPTSEEKDTGIKPLVYRDFLDKLWHKYEAYKEQGVNTYFNLKDHLWTLYLYEKGLFRIPEYAQRDMVYEGCHCGICHMTILPNGDVYACRRFESKVGIFSRMRSMIFLLQEKKTIGIMINLRNTASVN